MTATSYFRGGQVRTVDAGGVDVVVETVGSGHCVLLVHGFPHTRVIWREVADALVASGLAVAAVDLRGMGDSTRAESGYDSETIAGDLAAVVDALGHRNVHAVGIDLGAPAVFSLAATHPEQVASLTLMESALGGLPGAEKFFANGAPWWFGFHQAPGGLAERVVAGAEDTYVRYFLQAGSRRGIPDDMAATIVDAYRGRDSLRCAFEHYRAMPAAAEWTARWASVNRLTMPVLTIGGDTVGDTTARQLRAIADHSDSELIPEAGHIVCVDEPQRTAELVIRHVIHATSYAQEGIS